MSRANQPAYPADSQYSMERGLTLREHFAALAMQGILASWPANSRALDDRATAETATKFADSLLRELERKP